MKRAEIEEKKRIKEEEKRVHNEMEFYYRKYAQTFRYRFMRKIGDIKFKRKKRREAKGRPKPVYKPPVRTKEEQLAIDRQMKQLYKTYHVSRMERIRRWWEQRKRKYVEQSEGQT